MLLNFDFTLVMYHAVMEVNSTITATEQTVINRDLPNAGKNPVFLTPSK